MIAILLTGATGVVGSALLGRLLDAGPGSALPGARSAGGSGPNRVRVQITLGDLSNPVALRQAVRGVGAVVHLAATIRDQPAGSIEELNGVATARLLRYASGRGVERFVFFGAMGATPSSRTRFMRAKALAEHAVLESPLDATVLAPSIVYAPDDRWMTLLRRLALLPGMPVSGTGQASYQPIWAQDVAAALTVCSDGGSPDGARRLRAGRAGRADLRGDRAPGAGRVGSRAPARARPALDGEARAARCSSVSPAPRRSRPGRRPS